MITGTTPLQNLFDTAVLTLNELNAGETFLVKELFRGFEWNRIPKSDRTKLGSLFLTYSKGQGNALLKPIGKTPQNQQIYQKL